MGCSRLCPVDSRLAGHLLCVWVCPEPPARSICHQEDGRERRLPVFVSVLWRMLDQGSNLDKII